MTAEKEVMRSPIFDFLIAFIFVPKGLDHIFDHLASGSEWKQCDGEHSKTFFWIQKPRKAVVRTKQRTEEHRILGSLLFMLAASDFEEFSDNIIDKS